MPATHHVGGRGGRLLQRGTAVAPLPAAPRLPRRGPGRTLLAAAAHASRSPGRRGLLLRLDARALGRALRKGGRGHFKAPFSAWFSVRVSVHPTEPGERGKSSVSSPPPQGSRAHVRQNAVCDPAGGGAEAAPARPVPRGVHGACAAPRATRDLGGRGECWEGGEETGWA